MRIALDAMGTDLHPEVEVQGAVEALRELPGDFEVLLVGDQELVESRLAQCVDFPRARLSVVHASQCIAPGEAPAAAVRRKQDSSIVVGLTLQREGKADAFVSAGSTGAVMAASLFILRALPGVDRPPIATLLPTVSEPVLMLDSGANVDSKPHHLVQFAQLGAVYATDVLGRAVPRVGLLNIGEEPEKGNELAVEAYQLLAESGLEFIGNVEGRDVIRGVCDVLVTDGFVGNVLLKFYESVAGFIYEVATGSPPPAPGNAPSKLWQALDYTTYGGAPLLGVNGVSIICHGGSPPVAVRNAIGMAIQAVQSDMVGHIQQQLGGTLTTGRRRLAEGA